MWHQLHSKRGGALGVPAQRSFRPICNFWPSVLSESHWRIKIWIASALYWKTTEKETAHCVRLTCWLWLCFRNGGSPLYHFCCPVPWPFYLPSDTTLLVLYRSRTSHSPSETRALPSAFSLMPCHVLWAIYTQAVDSSAKSIPQPIGLELRPRVYVCV